MARRRKKYDIPKDTTLTGKEKCVIYARVSSPQQMKEGDGLRGQERLCREWAENSSIDVVKVFSDGGKSGKYSSIGDREGLSEMIEFLIEQNKVYTKIHFVVIDDMDRLIRDVQGWWEIKAQIEQLGGAKVYSLKQKIEDTPEGRMVQSITMATKQYQREANARQVKDKQRARMLRGYRPLYPAPGFVHKKTKTAGKVLIRTEDAELIRDALLLFAEGVLSSQTKLKDYLNSKGYRTRQGNKVNLEFVARLLGRERLLIYAGYIHYEHRNVSMVKAEHKPFFGLDIVEKILSKLNPKTYYVKSSESEIGRKLPLRGFLYDLKSGNKFSGGPSQGRRELFYYYSVRAPQDDGKKSISIDYNEINNGFRDYLGQFKVEQETFILFEEIMKDLYKKKTSVERTVKKDLQKRIDEIDKDIKMLMGRIRKTRTEEMIETYENEIISLKEEKAEITIKLEGEKGNEIDIDELITNTKVLLTNPQFIWDLGDIQLQKMLIGVLFNGKIFYDKKSGFQTPEIPLIYTLLSSSDIDKSRLVEMTGLEPVSESHNMQRLPTIVYE